MRNVVLSSICAAAIGLSSVSGAFAQASGMDRPGAPANNQTNGTGTTAGSDTGMNSMNKMKKKKMSKSKMKKGGMEKKM